METNKIQWKRISEGEALPCDSFLMKEDGTIPSVISVAGKRMGQDAYYLPIEELRTLPKEESEDKKMIQYIKDLAPFSNADELYKKYGFSHKEAIAWIEKQVEHANFCNKIQIGDKVTRNEDGVLVNLSQLKRVAKKDENQGEQKPTDLVAILKNYFAETPKEQREKDWEELKHLNDIGFDAEISFGANDSELIEATYNIPDGYHAEIDGDKVVIKKGEQKPVDKIEPKFKAGKWYLCVKDFWGKFVRFDKGHAYYCGLNGCLKEFDSGAHIAIDEKLYDYFNLWTIQDAKDGDVLADGDLPFIFKKIDANGYSYAYCGISVDDGFKIESEGEHGEWTMMQDIKPATKEQRDTLFDEMHESGYSWDAKKLELRKIEKQPNYCHHKVDLSECSEEYRKAYYDGWNNCNQQHAQLEAEQKPWSEEDECYINKLIIFCENCMIQDSGAKECANWLKELKHRIGGEANCTTTKEWSEEDSQIYGHILAIISSSEDIDMGKKVEMINWFKSFRPQNTWKPSDEQMNTLWDAIVFVEGCNSNFKGSGSVLENLYNDLKKLRKE